LLKQPVDPQDAATKKYVDDKFDAGLTSGIDSPAVSPAAGETVGETADQAAGTATRSPASGGPPTYDISFMPVIYIKNSVGFIPNLLSCYSKSGFITSASHKNIASYRPFAAAPNLEWDTGTLHVTEASPISLDLWIQIKLTEPIKIHKFAIREKHSPSPSDKIRGWKLLGSFDGLIFDTLLEMSDSLDPTNVIDQTTKFFNIPPLSTLRFADSGGLLIPAKASHPAYLYYRFKIDHPGPTNPGINFFQIFPLDVAISDYIA